MRRIKKRTNSAIFFLLTSFSISVIAEPKMLVCETTAEAEEKRLRGIATEYRDNIENSRRILREEQREKYAKEFDAKADACKDAKHGIGIQHIFTFDTKGLSSTEFSNVEVRGNYLCGTQLKDVMKGTIEATPTIITFEWVDQIDIISFRDRFNIDRKNLTGGFDTERNYTCVLSDIDTSENLL